MTVNSPKHRRIPMPTELLTVKDVAKQLKVTDIYIYDLVNARKIDVILVGKKRYFTQEMIDKFIHDHTLEAKS
jgi:excisionase family DNA binding protein